MTKLGYTVFLIYATLLTKASESEEDYVVIENESNNYLEDFKSLLKSGSSEDGRILWPYPLNYKPEDVPNSDVQQKIKDRNESTSDENRKQRFLRFSYPQSPLVDLMMQTVSINYSPTNARDPFDFLRDSYPLPKGSHTLFMDSVLRLGYIEVNGNLVFKSAY